MKAQKSHLEHIEDLMFEFGKEGLEQTFLFLLGVKDGSLNVSVKMDGAPSIVAGTDPLDGQFFVAKKSFFNVNPKLYKTPQDVDADTDGELAQKLKLALEHLPKLGIKGIVQGDFLFSRQDLSRQKIEGKEYITFHPNTIVYAVEVESELAKRILQAQIGIVWHTSYSGNDVRNLTPSYNRKITDGLNQTPEVFTIDSSIVSSENTTDFSKFDSVLKSTKKKAESIDASVWRLFESNAFKAKIKTFINSLVRTGTTLNSGKHMRLVFTNYLKKFFDLEMAKRSTEKGKQVVRLNKEQILEMLEKHSDNFDQLFDVFLNIQKLKTFLVHNIQTDSSIQTFIQKGLEFIPTKHEGFVVSDKNGNVTKLIDRMEFSKLNFSDNIKKGFVK